MKKAKSQKPKLRLSELQEIKNQIFLRRLIGKTHKKVSKKPGWEKFKKGDDRDADSAMRLMSFLNRREKEEAAQRKPKKQQPARKL